MTTREGVIDRATWARGVILQVAQLAWVHAAAVDVVGGYSGKHRHAAGLCYRVESDGQHWAVLLDVLSQTRQHVVVIQDGARYYTGKAMKQFFDAHADRFTIEQLPAYSPDFNPIEYLWRKAKKDATHLKYFLEFPDFQVEVERALLHFAQAPLEIIVMMARYYESLGAVTA